MGSRWYAGFVLVFWLAAMSWLLVAKVLPPLVGGQAPDYRAPLAEALQEPPVVAWRLIWEEREIGRSMTRVRALPERGAEVRSLVHFRKLEVDKVLQQLLGNVFAKLVPSLGADDLQLDLTIASRLKFDSQQTLEHVDASLQVAGAPHVLNLHGDLREGRTLEVIVFTGSHFPAPGKSDGAGVFRHQLDLPRDALVGDAFAPNSELRNLEVGQTWTIPVYRPFPPNSPVQIIEAKAERLDLIHWSREPVEVVVVVYRDEAGSGIAASRRPIGRVWVRPDGMVLRQEAIVSNLHLIFERMTDEESAAYAAELDDARYLPLLPKGLPSESEKPAQ